MFLFSWRKYSHIFQSLRFFYALGHGIGWWLSTPANSHQCLFVTGSIARLFTDSMSVSVCVWVSVSMCAYVHVCVSVCMGECVCACVCVHVWVCVHVCVCAYVRVCAVAVYVCACMCCVYVCEHACMCTYHMCGCVFTHAHTDNYVGCTCANMPAFTRDCKLLFTGKLN